MKTWNRWARLAAAGGSLLWVGVAAGESATAPNNMNTYSSDRAGSSSNKSDTTATSQSMTGKISKLDADQRTIELQGDRKLKVGPSTEIRRDGQRASFSDLHEGDEVRASFSGNSQTNVKRIEVVPGTGSSSSDSSSMGSPSTGSSSSGTSSAHQNGTSYGGPAGTAAGSSVGTVPPKHKPAGQ